MNKQQIKQTKNRKGTLYTIILVLLVLATGTTTSIAGAAERQTAVSATTSVILDTTFSTDGIQTTNFGGTDEAQDVALQADGSIIVVGTNSNKLAMVRYTSAGALDTSFDGDGKQTDTALGTGRAVALQDDGHIVVVGSTNSLNFGTSRYKTDGSADDSFGSSGHVTTDMGGFDQAHGVAIDHNNKIVVVGSNGDFALVRYASDGELDTGFGNAGKQTTNFKGSDTAYDVAISDTNYDIIVVGKARDAIGTGTDFAVARYSSSGILDSGFDSDGKHSFNLGSDDSWSSVALQADGKIVAAGTNGADFVVARYTNDGSLDTSFDSDGVQTIDFGGTDEARDVVIQPDGKIIVAGFTDGQSMNLTRLNSDGSLDTNFGTNGLITLQIGSSGTEGYGVALQADHKIVIVGYRGSDFAVARYENPCLLPAFVSNESEWNAAIECFNEQTTAGTYEITLTADILLSSSPPAIDNTTGDVELLIEGAGFKIDGQDISGMRPVIITQNTDVTMQNITVTGGNGSEGGGILSDGTLLLQDSTITGNQAFSAPGIKTEGGNLTIRNSTIHDNHSPSGGAVVNAGGAVLLVNSEIYNNTSSQPGGALLNGGQTIIQNSTIRNNNGPGGGVLVNFGELSIYDSTFSQNYGAAAVIWNDGDFLVMSNSTISGNTVAGIENYEQATLTHVTIANNSRMGISNSASSLVMAHTILADNALGDCETVDSFTQTYSLIETDSATNPCAAGNTITGIDPGLGTLQDNGGDTETQAIGSTSIAHNAVPVVNGSCNNTGITADQRGVTRPQGSACDMGAFELEPSCLPAAVANETELNAAIVCFNEQTTAGSYNITLTADISLTASTTTIDNSTAGVELLLEGANFAIDGQDIAGVRPLTVAADTDVTVQNITLTGGNVNPNNGGGLKNEGTLLLLDSTITGNKAFFNGAIDHESGDLTIRDSAIHNNEATINGGISNDANGAVLIVDSEIYDNSSSTGAAGLYNNGRIATIQNSTFRANSGGSGGVIVNYSPLYVYDSTFSENFNTTDVIYHDGDSLVISNSTISGNSTSGGIQNYNRATLTHVTLANNSGKGLRNESSNLTLANSILADNAGGDCETVEPFAQAYSLIETDSATQPCAITGTITGTDPGLGTLQNNGGDTETQAIGTTSVAYNAVPVVNGSCNDTGITADQRGVTRPQGTACDMGAYEYEASCLPAAVANETELNEAIVCFNEQTTAGSYNITLTADIFLITSTTAIDNSTSGVELLVEGAGFAVDGQEIEGVRPFFIQTDTTVTLQNIIVRNGKTAEHDDGGGVLVNAQGTLTVKNSQILNNDADSEGGGIYNLGTLTVENTTVANNSSSGNGGGILAINGATTFIDGSTFTNNSNGEAGGAIAMDSANQLYVNNSTFNGNRSDEAGGAISNSNSIATIENSTFVGNETSQGTGGTLATGARICFTGDMEVLLADGKRKRIADVAVGDEVLSYDFVQGKQITSRVEHLIQREVDSFLRLNDLEVTDEHPFAVGEDEWRTAAELEIGDRVLSEQGWTTITSKTRVFKEVEVYNLSVTGPHNYYVFDGQETYLVHNKNVAAGVGDMTLNNVIVTNSMGAGGSGSDCLAYGAEFVGSNNLIDDHAAGSCSGISEAAVTNLSLTLADNGGATQTHALLPGSNALEAGANCSDTDQRGVARPQNSACDIGAYELWQLGITADSAPAVTLSWGTAVSGCTYDVYEATVPYAPHAAPTYTGVSADYDINNRLGDPTTHHFFVTSAICNSTTVYTNEVGEFEFEIVPGS